MALRSEQHPNGGRVYESVLEMLPNRENPTPLVRLNAIIPFDHTEVWAKLEWFNPFGSVKDRVAAGLVESASADGSLTAGQPLVEPTSGNTGLGLAMVGNQRGHQIVTPLSSAVPDEKKVMLRLSGAAVEELSDDLCPAPGAPDGAIARAETLSSTGELTLLNQYTNPANPLVHYRTTGPEIWDQTGGMVTHFAAALGTCGTIRGAGSYLREQNPQVNLIGVHPTERHDIPGVRSLSRLRQTAFFDPDEYDDLVEIDDEIAYALCARLNRSESIPAGPSSGLALAGVLDTVPDREGTLVVVVFPDSAFKYSTALQRHDSSLGSAPTSASDPAREVFLDAMIENARSNPELTVDVAEAEAVVAGGGVVIDVRNSTSFQSGHVAGAIGIPLLELPKRLAELPDDLETPILSICQRGNLSLSGVLFLKSLGFTNARSVNGGTLAWVDAGNPVVRGP